MPTGHPVRGHKYKFREAQEYLDLRKSLFDRLIAGGKLPPDGRIGFTHERFWYSDTLDNSPIKGHHVGEKRITP